MWEKSIEFTHTQTFFPESLLLNVNSGRSPGLRLVVYLPILKYDLRSTIYEVQIKKRKSTVKQWFCR